MNKMNDELTKWLELPIIKKNIKQLCILPVHLNQYRHFVNKKEGEVMDQKIKLLLSIVDSAKKYFNYVNTNYQAYCLDELKQAVKKWDDFMNDETDNKTQKEGE